MGVLTAVLLSFLIGWLIVCLAWPQDFFRQEQLLLRLSLAMGCGLGFMSLILFWVFIFSRSAAVLAASDSGFVAVLAALFLLVRRPSLTARTSSVHPLVHPHFLKSILSWSLVIALFLSLYGLVQRVRANPEGEGWDAFAIWNLHARFLFLGGEHWQERFTNIIPWSHPDYPLLLPASIAHFWSFMKRDSVAVPAFIALAFTLATLGILMGALAQLRGRTQATLAGIVLLGTPFFLQHGVSQYADVTLGYFFLGALVLVWLSGFQDNARLLILSGVMGGFAAWTKNEGQLFMCAFLVSLAAVQWRSRGFSACLHDSSLVLAGVLPAIATLTYFKLRIAPPGDLFAGNSMLLKAVDLHRYLFIVRWYIKEFFVFGNWFLFPGTVLILVYGWFMGMHRDQEQASVATISALTMALTIAGYFAIFVITPNDLRWHLRYSLNRLFLQLWPSALFLFFMLVRTPDEALNARPLTPSSAE